MGFLDKLKKAAKDVAKEVGEKAKEGIDGAKQMYEENKPPSEEEKKELEPRIQRAIKNGGDFGNLMYEMTVLGRRIEIILSKSDHKRNIEPKKPEGIWASDARCNILGFSNEKNKNYVLNVDEKVYGCDHFYLSFKAITTAIYMGYELDSTEKISSVIKDKKLLIDTYNIINYKVNDWEAIMEYMLNNPYSEHKKQLDKEIVKKKQQDEKEKKERAEKAEKEKKERLERKAQKRKEQETSVLNAYNKVPIGGILLSGSTRHIVFQGDKIELRSDDSGIIKANIPDQDFFIEDVRGVSVHLAKNVALNALTSGPISESLSYIRFDLKGENVQAEPAECGEW